MATTRIYVPKEVAAHYQRTNPSLYNQIVSRIKVVGETSYAYIVEAPYDVASQIRSLIDQYNAMKRGTITGVSTSTTQHKVQIFVPKDVAAYYQRTNPSLYNQIASKVKVVRETQQGFYVETDPDTANRIRQLISQYNQIKTTTVSAQKQSVRLFIPREVAVYYQRTNPQLYNELARKVRVIKETQQGFEVETDPATANRIRQLINQYNQVRASTVRLFVPKDVAVYWQTKDPKLFEQLASRVRVIRETNEGFEVETDKDTANRIRQLINQFNQIKAQVGGGEIYAIPKRVVNIVAERARPLYDKLAQAVRVVKEDANYLWVVGSPDTINKIKQIVSAIGNNDILWISHSELNLLRQRVPQQIFEQYAKQVRVIYEDSDGILITAPSGVITTIRNMMVQYGVRNVVSDVDAFLLRNINALRRLKDCIYKGYQLLYQVISSHPYRGKIIIDTIYIAKAIEGFLAAVEGKGWVPIDKFEVSVKEEIARALIAATLSPIGFPAAVVGAGLKVQESWTQVSPNTDVNNKPIKVYICFEGMCYWVCGAPEVDVTKYGIKVARSLQELMEYARRWGEWYETEIKPRVERGEIQPEQVVGKPVEIYNTATTPRSEVATTQSEVPQKTLPVSFPQEPEVTIMPISEPQPVAVEHPTTYELPTIEIPQPSGGTFVPSTAFFTEEDYGPFPQIIEVPEAPQIPTGTSIYEESPEPMEFIPYQLVGTTTTQAFDTTDTRTLEEAEPKTIEIDLTKTMEAQSIEQKHTIDPKLMLIGAGFLALLLLGGKKGGKAEKKRKNEGEATEETEGRIKRKKKIRIEL